MKNAFTIAEVLITLGIIGVVAAMTLPTIIDNSRNKQLESALKKSYSTIAQALDMYYAEEGVRLTPKNCGRLQLKPILMKYINTVRDCGTDGRVHNSSKLCIVHNAYLTEEEKADVYKAYKSLDGNSDVNMGVFDDGQFVINDTSLVLIENNNNKNLFISVDVNGFNRRPNRLGIDLFMFQISDEGALLPMGIEGTYYTHTFGKLLCDNTLRVYMNGAACTYRALTEKDYFKNLPR